VPPTKGARGSSESGWLSNQSDLLRYSSVTWLP